MQKLEEARALICSKCKTVWFARTRFDKDKTETTLDGYCGCGDKLQRRIRLE